MSMRNNVKSNFIPDLFHKFSNQQFKEIASYTFIVYFIAAFCGWFNLCFAQIFRKFYFPLRSYLITFDPSQLTNFPKSQRSIYNLAGFKTIIDSHLPYKLIDDLFFILLSTLLIILFYCGYKSIELNKATQGEIIKWSIIFSVLMAFSIPSNSSDLFAYVARGAQQSIYHQNPYLETISSINGYKDNPLFFNFMWPRTVGTYGPIFNYVSKAIVYLNNNNFVLSLINFKLLNLTIFFLLILFTLKMNNTKNLFLIAWNPLIMIQGLWNCHNDLISGALIFLGLYLLVKEKHFWGIFALTVAAGIKFVSLLIIPVIFFYFLKTKPEKHIFVNLVLGLCCGILLITILSIDYIIPGHNLTSHNITNFLASVGLVHKSLIAAIITVIKYLTNLQETNLNLISIQSIVKYVVYSIFGIFYIWILSKRGTNLASDVTLVLFIFFAFTIAKFHSWYLLNVIVLIPFLDRGEVTSPLRKLLIVLSMSHTYAITFLDQAKIVNFISMTLLPTIFILFKEKKSK